MFTKKLFATFNRNAKVKKGHTYTQWLIAILSSSILLEYGFLTGWVSPMKKVLQSPESPTGYVLSDLEVSFLASSSSLAAILAVPLSAFVAEVYGRKIGVILTMLFYALCWCIKLLATHPGILIAARVFGGFGLGCTFIVIPMYIREISQDSIRGTLITLNISVQPLGILAVYAMGTYLDYYTVLWTCLGVSILATLLMLLMPESPVFLVKQGKIDLAAESLAKLRGLEVDDDTVKDEIDYMKTEDEFYKTEKILTYTEIFKNKAWRRGYFLCQILAICIAFQGTFAIVTFAWQIMTQAGVTVNPELQSFIVPILLLCGTVVPMVLIEKVGRKLLLLVSYSVAAVSLGCLASTLLLQQQGVTVPGWVPGLTIAFTVFVYSGGALPIPNVIMNDIFKFQVRAKLLGLIHMVNWGSASLQVLLFVPVSEALGMSSVFFISMAVNITGALIVLIFVPETKGRSVEQIEAILAGNKKEAIGATT